MALKEFHSSSQRWFESQFGAPTAAQLTAWPAIKQGKHTLIAAPTGSGKTLAAFYCAIDDLVWKGLQAPLPDQTSIVYISPLKALSNDIHRNLEIPLDGIAEHLHLEGYPPVNITMAVRTGDTTQSQRQQMVKNPPHILVTTPESFYLLLTSVNGRKMLANVETIIIDEIHALIGDKRGSHLSLSVERLEALTCKPLQRIGLSATQRPIELVANYLVGNKKFNDGVIDCFIADTGHRRELDISLEVPRSPLTALMSNEVWEELYERLVQLIEAHDTTLVFVNTRRLSERLALSLSERIGEDTVCSHHGSMSKDHRHAAEQKLKSGKLKVLVATASMELGIDIGSVDLVVQFSSPKSISKFIQRVGRSGHSVTGTPKGIIFPLTRDDLVECTALLDSVSKGELDQIVMPSKPLDILAQQIVAEVASYQSSSVIKTETQSDEFEEGGWKLDDLYSLFTGAFPYKELSKEEFLQVINMLADGYTTRRGRRGAFLHLDMINERVRARRNARLTALTNGGAIPDMFEYQVVLDPEDIVVGSLNEDFALEALPGDVFTLGTHSWQLLRIDGLKVRVRDAQGMSPTIPFWFGEGPGRTRELSESVSNLRQKIDDFLVSGEIQQARDWLVDDLRLPPSAAEQLVEYLQVGRNALQHMPTRKCIVMERFFDEVGDMHVVIHSPFGSRINRGWGLALRKKFCRTFNFELQAAANEDSIVISLGSVHSFALDEVFRYLQTASLRDVLIQALLDAPMFEVRWRWNATRSLAIQRNRNGKRVPPQFQRMDAEDLVAQVFPDQIACFENIRGTREVPDHPLVKQTIHDCLTEAMDIEQLEELIGAIENDELQLVAKDLREPSPFAQEIINARPYAFLDDAPFEERRTNAIRNRSWVDPGEQEDFSVLDASAINQVKEEAWPCVRSSDELHDALCSLVFMTEDEINKHQYTQYSQQLVAAGRASQVKPVQDCSSYILVAAERWPMLKAVYPDAIEQPVLILPESLKTKNWQPEQAIIELVRGRLEGLGPITNSSLHKDSLLSTRELSGALLALETEGFVFQGYYSRFANPQQKEIEWCERRLLQRIHRYTIDSHRKSIRPVSLQSYMRFLFELHEIEPDRTINPRPGLRLVTDEQAKLQRTLARLDGICAPAAAWEADIYPARMSNYDPNWLDVMCISGKVSWGRYALTANSTQNNSARKTSGPIKSTPITIAVRENLDIWQALFRKRQDSKRQFKRKGVGKTRPDSKAVETPGDEELSVPSFSTVAERIETDLRNHGASFFADISQRVGLLKSQLEQGLAELVNAGRITSDSYTGLRALLTPSNKKPGTGRRRGRRALFGIEDAGRWSLINREGVGDENASTNVHWDLLNTDQIERLIVIYLERWGVVFRRVLDRESFAPPWRVLLSVLRKMELRGELRGGRFISGVGGEQFAYSDTVDKLRKVNKSFEERPDDSEVEYISLAATDPLNLMGVILPETKLAKLASNRVMYKDGIPIAVLETNKVKFLRDVESRQQWQLQQALTRRSYPPQLRAYLGKL